jgi:hypothetical protein
MHILGVNHFMSRNNKFYIPKCSQRFVEYETVFHFDPNGRTIKKSKMASKMAAKFRKNSNYHYLANVFKNFKVTLVFTYKYDRKYMFTVNKLFFVHFYGRNVKYLKEYHGKCIKNNLKIKFDINFLFPWQHISMFISILYFCAKYNFNSYHLWQL